MRLLHLAPASRAGSIARTGLKGAAARIPGPDGAVLALPRAVFAMPVLKDFWVTYQWLREMRRGHDERMVAVELRLPDDEPVHVGRFGKPHTLLGAAAAAAWVAKNPAGAELVVPRSLTRREVLKIRDPPQLVGWTGYPEEERSHRCVCPACVPRGSRDLMRRVRGAWAEGLAEARAAGDAPSRTEGLNRLEIPLERARGRLDPARLVAFARDPAPTVRAVVARLLALVPRAQGEATLVALAADPDPRARAAAAFSLGRVAGIRRAARLLAHAPEDAVLALLEWLDPELDPGDVRAAREELGPAAGPGVAARLAELATSSCS